jgi:hypothetical protein
LILRSVVTWTNFKGRCGGGASLNDGVDCGFFVVLIHGLELFLCWKLCCFYIHCIYYAIDYIYLNNCNRKKLFILVRSCERLCCHIYKTNPTYIAEDWLLYDAACQAEKCNTKQ